MYEVTDDDSKHGVQAILFIKNECTGIELKYCFYKKSRIISLIIAPKRDWVGLRENLKIKFF